MVAVPLNLLLFITWLEIVMCVKSHFDTFISLFDKYSNKDAEITQNNRPPL